MVRLSNGITGPPIHKTLTPREPKGGYCYLLATSGVQRVGESETELAEALALQNDTYVHILRVLNLMSYAFNLQPR